MYIYILLATACCIWSVISSISNLNQWSSSLGVFCHVPLKRDQRDWDWRSDLNDTPSAIDCTLHCHCNLARTQRMPHLHRSFLHKSPIISGIFCRCCTHSDITTTKVPYLIALSCYSLLHQPVVAFAMSIPQKSPVTRGNSAKEPCN